jgi:hypothetical protein
MTRYYFHLWDGERYVVDEVGDELESAEAAYLEAFAVVQEMVVDLVRERRDPAAHQLNVVDASGRALFEVMFAEALGVAAAPAGLAPDRRRPRALLQSVAQQIAVARTTLAAAKQTLERARRQSIWGAPPHSGEPPADA